MLIFGRFFTCRALQGIYPTLIIVLVSLNLAQDRVQGPAIDTGLKFASSSAPQSTCTRALSFSRPRTTGSSEGDFEGGIELVTRAEHGAGNTRVESNPDPDRKGCIGHQVAEVF